VKGRVATLRIVSGYSEDVAYKATLTMRKDGKAAWNVIDRTTGQTYIPEVALMAVTGLSSGASDPVDLPDDGMMTGADIIRAAMPSSIPSICPWKILLRRSRTSRIDRGWGSRVLSG
jgi:hypothetical protein